MPSLLQLFVAALCIAQVFSTPTSKAFTALVEVVEKDGSSGKLTWSYDAGARAEHIVFHREAGVQDTTYLRLYEHQMEYLVVEGKCYAQPIAEKALPPVGVRVAQLSDDKEFIKWENIAEGPVAPALFNLPPACPANNGLGDGLFCPSCLSIGGEVIDLGCNATSNQISNLCGTTFAAICKMLLQQLCNGICHQANCAAEVCCFFDLCEGSTCNNGTTTGSSAVVGGSATLIVDEMPAKEPASVGAGLFCSTCIAVTEQVVSLGCNATATQIANLCGNFLEKACYQVLETVCSGYCTISGCAATACCAVSLCSGNTCNTTSVAHAEQGLVKLPIADN